MPTNDQPSAEQRRHLREALRPDSAVHGFGFTIREDEWVIWISIAKGSNPAGRPREMMGYKVIYEDTGPFFADPGADNTAEEH